MHQVIGLVNHAPTAAQTAVLNLQRMRTTGPGGLHSLAFAGTSKRKLDRKSNSRRCGLRYHFFSRLSKRLVHINAYFNCSLIFPISLVTSGFVSIIVRCCCYCCHCLCLFCYLLGGCLLSFGATISFLSALFGGSILRMFTSIMMVMVQDAA